MTHLVRAPRFVSSLLRSAVVWPLLTLALTALTGCGVGGIDAIDNALGNGGGGGGTPAATMSVQERTYADRVLELVNEERATFDLPPVAWSEAAAEAAYGHAVDMDLRNYFDHDTPEGRSPGDRLAAAGAGGRGWGENIAMGQGSPESVMAAWMNSAGHRANILNASFRYLGVGVHVAVDGPWWVQNFLTP